MVGNLLERYASTVYKATMRGTTLFILNISYTCKEDEYVPGFQIASCNSELEEHEECMLGTINCKGLVTMFETPSSPILRSNLISRKALQPTAFSMTTRVKSKDMLVDEVNPILCMMIIPSTLIATVILLKKESRQKSHIGTGVSYVKAHRKYCCAELSKAWATVGKRFSPKKYPK